MSSALLLQFGLVSCLCLAACSSSDADNTATDAGSSDAPMAEVAVDGGAKEVGVTDVGGDGGAADGGGCSFIDELTSGCSVQSDCMAFFHQTDCCGQIVAKGISASNMTSRPIFKEETACRDSYAKCGCPAGPVQTDSGETAPVVDKVKIDCVKRGGAGTCMTYVTTRPADMP